MSNRPPEAPDWIEAPYPWDGAGEASPASIPASETPAPSKPFGYKFLAGVLALGLLGSLFGGVVTSRLRSQNASATTPTTLPFDNGFRQIAPYAPPSQSPSVNRASVDTDGIVNITTSSTISGLRAAGTGMVLTANGDVLTNNHVVEGATRIAVTTVADGKTYTASVVGVSPTDDVALLRIADAHDLKTIPLGRSSSVNIGDDVVSAGNAGGVGGTPTIAAGNVTALNQTIEVKDELDDATETLRGLIQTSVPLQQGESGGPMFNKSNKVIGINTAASSGFQRGGTEGYAIPIDHALSVVELIRDGKETDRIHIGVRGFLGVQTGDSSNIGAQVLGVQAGSPAAGAGLTSGDLITAVDGDKVDDPSSLIKLIREHRPGETVIITWTTAGGEDKSAKVELAKGAAD